MPRLDEPIGITGGVIHNSFFLIKDAGSDIDYIDIDEKNRELLIQKLKSTKGLEWFRENACMMEKRRSKFI